MAETYHCVLCGKDYEDPVVHDAECGGAIKADSGLAAVRTATIAVDLLRKLVNTHSQFDKDADQARAFLKDLDG